jgi:hypothetical protein
MSLIALSDKTTLSLETIMKDPYLKAFHQVNKSSILSRTKMVISFGVGVFGKHGVAEDKGDQLTLHSIQRTFNQRNPSQDLSSFISLSAHHLDEDHNSLSQWKDAFQTLNTIKSLDHSEVTTMCSSESQLSFEFITPSQLVIGNLDSYLDQSLDARHQSSCVRSLLSHFITTYSDTIADIRLRFPKYPNNHFNKGIVQTETYSQNYPYHAAGLDGTGQIVGVGDTGIDELSCFFRNSDNSKVARSTIFNPTFDLSKRKVIQYINYADGKDLAGGHGTHVSGTIAGSSAGFVSSGIIYGGHAPGAKIAFFDMELSSSPNSGLRIPSPTGTYVFQPAYDAGARIHSNSWGSPLNACDDDDLSVDSFQYSHKDFLAVFAAGNDGSEGFYSIGQPGTTKNSLTVGASRSDGSADISKVAYFSSLGPTFDERIKVRNDPSLSHLLISLTLSLSLCLFLCLSLSVA